MPAKRDRYNLSLSSNTFSNWEMNPELWKVNVGGTISVLEAAKECSLRVYTPSSIAVFGPDSLPTCPCRCRSKPNYCLWGNKGHRRSSCSRIPIRVRDRYKGDPLSRFNFLQSTSRGVRQTMQWRFSTPLLILVTTSASCVPILAFQCFTWKMQSMQRYP